MLSRSIQDEYSWDRVKHLPVNRYGYNHKNNSANRYLGYIRAEEMAWQYARDRAPRSVIDLAWFVGISLGRAHERLDRLKLKLKDN